MIDVFLLVLGVAAEKQGGGSSILPILGAAGGIAALITALVVLMKVGVEKTDVKIGTAEKVMFGQDRFIEQLEAGIKAQLERINNLSDDVDTLRLELRAVTDERDRLKRENFELRSRITHLEQRVNDLAAKAGEEPERPQDDDYGWPPRPF